MSQKNQSIKVKYRAFDMAHEEIFPIDMEVGRVHAYLNTICNTYIIVEMSPTTKESTVKNA